VAENGEIDTMTNVGQPRDGALAVQDVTGQDVIADGQATIRLEAEALAMLADVLDESFPQSVQLILATRGRVIVTGVGKSGHIGRKIASTFASTGTPACFVHAGEAAHGDLGMVTERDLMIVLSHSGMSRELKPVLVHAHKLGCPVIGVTANRDSPLGRHSTIVLPLPKMREACPARVAPTTSTTMTLALGDALAMATMRIRGITRHDLVHWHPGGSIGYRLMPVDDIVDRRQRMPLVSTSASMRDVVLMMTSCSKGATGVVDEEGNLVGIITDGDLRRAFDRIHEAHAADVMTHAPITVPSGTLIEDVIITMTEAKITVLFLMEAQNPRRPAGLVHIHDLAMAA
jgi:arabinose-5-phosphate isomerase